MASEDRFAERPHYGDDINQEAFEQILEMDDDDETREFSKQIVFDFFEQAKSTFDTMDKALKEEELDKLSEEGHFLKGSSATIGLTKVKDACEKIQNWGHCKDDAGEPTLTKAEALKRIKNILPKLRADSGYCEEVLTRFYRE